MSDLEAREFIEEVNRQFQAELTLEGILFSKDEKREAKKIFLFTGSHAPKVPAEWIGQHFATIDSDGSISLSIEGAEKVGETAKKTVNLSRNEADEAMAGKGFDIEEKPDGFYIMKTGDKALGLCRVEGKNLISLVPKSRRTHQQYRD